MTLVSGNTVHAVVVPLCHKEDWPKGLAQEKEMETKARTNTHTKPTKTNLSKRGQWPRPPMFEFRGMAPQRF